MNEEQKQLYKESYKLNIRLLTILFMRLLRYSNPATIDLLFKRLDEIRTEFKENIDEGQ